MQATNILVVDDEKDICKALNLILSKEGYTVTEAYNGEEALERIKDRAFDIVLTDIKMDRMDGLELLKETKEVSPATSVVMMTAFGSEALAVEAMRAGAEDYLKKPFTNIDEVRIRIKNIVEKRGLASENEILRQELSQRRDTFKNIIGNSEAMQKI